MNGLEGPRLYYSLFGVRGLLLGGSARFLRRPVAIIVAVPRIKHPIRLRLRTTDVALCRDILLKGQYDWEFSRSPRVIVDAGANVGLAAIFYANKYPESRIFAIEPEPSNYEILARNVSPYSNIVPLHAALWSEDRELGLVDSGTGHTTFRTTANNETISTEARQRTRGITLNTLMVDFGIDYVDLLKVDIEGSEKEVFERSGPWIGSVGVIAVELHDWIQQGCSHAVHSAAKSFEFSWNKGETTYFATRNYALNGEMPTRGLVDHSSAAHRLVTSRCPIRILETA